MSPALRPALAAAALLATLPIAAHAADAPACKMSLVGELHVLADAPVPLIPSEINGHKVFLLADTGSFTNLLLRKQAARLGVKVIDAEAEAYGVGGQTRLGRGTIDALKLDTLAMTNVPMLVGGENENLGRPDLVGSIGSGVFVRFAVEFDLADHVIRFFNLSKDCKGGEVVYWGGPFSEAETKDDPSQSGHYWVDVALNGKKLLAELDTGTSESVVATDAANVAHVGTNSPGVKSAGKNSGIGAEKVDFYDATFDTFSIGQETIKNAKVQIADLFGADAQMETGSRVAHRLENTPEMLLGSDFFRAHRVLVVPSQRKVYFTYKGGPVFHVREAPDAKPTEPKPAP